MMRTSTYYRLTNLYKIYKGYVSTKGLMEEGLSNRQIAALTEEDYLEKVCHGCYWMKQCGYEKPDDYKCIEVCLSNPRAVIAMGSACYYQGGVSYINEKCMFLSGADKRRTRIFDSCNRADGSQLHEDEFFDRKTLLFQQQFSGGSEKSSDRIWQL